MSQVHYDPVSLEQRVRDSTEILLVTAGKPATLQLSVQIAEDPENVPPCPKTVYRFEIVEVLRSSGATPVAGTIEVNEANFSSHLDLHRMYYIEGISESPIYPLYTPSKAPTGGRSIMGAA